MYELKQTPRQIVSELDEYIVGQHAAKKSVAVALRNRYRRLQLDEKMQQDITPKNMLMIGPTGVGKTKSHDVWQKSSMHHLSKSKQQNLLKSVMSEEM